MATPPAIVSRNADGYIESIQRLEIQGSFWDVTFRYQSSFDQIFGAGDPPDIREPSFYIDGAEAARAAISDVLTTQGITNDGSVPNVLYVPYRTAETGNQLRGVNVHATGADIGSDIWMYFHPSGEFPRSTTLANSQQFTLFFKKTGSQHGWATFEPADSGTVGAKDDE